LQSEPQVVTEWDTQGFPALRLPTIGAFAYVATLPSFLVYMLFNAAGPDRRGKGGADDRVDAIVWRGPRQSASC